jgi:hypothetical protein
MRADLYPLQVLLVALAGWISRRQQEVVAYLVEENRVLKQQLGKKREKAEADGGSAAATRREGQEARASSLERRRHDRDARHAPEVTPTADRPEVDVSLLLNRSPWGHAGDRPADRTDGDSVDAKGTGHLLQPVRH